MRDPDLETAYAVFKHENIEPHIPRLTSPMVMAKILQDLCNRIDKLEILVNQMVWDKEE